MKKDIKKNKNKTEWSRQNGTFLKQIEDKNWLSCLIYCKSWCDKESRCKYKP